MKKTVAIWKKIFKKTEIPPQLMRCDMEKNLEKIRIPQKFMLYTDLCLIKPKKPRFIIFKARLSVSCEQNQL